MTVWCPGECLSRPLCVPEVQLEVELSVVQLPAQVVAQQVVAGRDQLAARLLAQLTAVAMVTGDALHVGRVSQPVIERAPNEHTRTN